MEEMKDPDQDHASVLTSSFLRRATPTGYSLPTPFPPKSPFALALRPSSSGLPSPPIGCVLRPCLLPSATKSSVLAPNRRRRPHHRIPLPATFSYQSLDDSTPYPTTQYVTSVVFPLLVLTLYTDAFLSPCFVSPTTATNPSPPRRRSGSDLSSK